MSKDGRFNILFDDEDTDKWSLKTLNKYGARTHTAGYHCDVNYIQVLEKVDFP